MARITNSLRHVHKYFRMPSTGLWYCAGKEGCTHYRPKNMPGPEGSLSDCWWCDKPFLLTPLNMESNKPICDECTEKKRIADSIANEIPDYTPIGRDAFKSSEQRMFELGKRNVEAEEARKKAETEKKVEETDQIEVDEPSEENE